MHCAAPKIHTPATHIREQSEPYALGWLETRRRSSRRSEETSEVTIGKGERADYRRGRASRRSEERELHFEQ